MMKCTNAHRYKGIRPPKCGCVVCSEIWKDVQIAHIYESVSTIILVKCDKCQIEQKFGVDEDIAIDAIYKIGWRANDNGIYCPRCIPKSLKSKL